VLLAPSLSPVVLILVAVPHRSALTRHLQAVATTDAKTGLLTSLPGTSAPNNSCRTPARRGPPPWC